MSSKPDLDPELQSLATLLQGRYQPLQSLSHHGGRQTILAFDPAMDRQVVVKILTFGDELAWEVIKLFKREAETLRSLQHPAIPQYIDAFEVGNGDRSSLVTVQASISALNLEQQILAGRLFSEVEVQQIAQQALKILVYLHQQSPPVIHRDLKPSNILLASSDLPEQPGQVYFVDFGSVQASAAQAGQTFTVVGSYGYMSPEQFGGQTVPASDLYSLGATLVYLLTGKNPAELEQGEMALQIDGIAGISSDFRQWLGQLTAMALDLRFVSANAALNQLEKLIQRSVALANPTAACQPQLAQLSRLLMTGITYSCQGSEFELHFPISQLACRKLNSATSLKARSPKAKFLVSLEGQVGVTLGFLSLIIPLVVVLLLSSSLLWFSCILITISLLLSLYFGLYRKVILGANLPGATFQKVKGNRVTLAFGVSAFRLMGQEGQEELSWKRRYGRRLTSQPQAFGLSLLIADSQIDFDCHGQEAEILTQILSQYLNLPVEETE